MAAFDHRRSLDRDLARLGIDPSGELRASLKTLIWRGVASALPGVPAGADAAVLIDRGHPGIVAAAKEADVVVALALEASGEAELRPAADPGALAEDLRALGGGLGKVLLRWHPGDSAGRKRRQLAALRRLAGLTRACGGRLLLELLLPPSPGDLAGSGAGRRYADEVLPRRQVDAIAEILHAGVSPGIWKLEGHPDGSAARELAGLLDGRRPPAGVLVLGGGTGIADLGRIFSGGAGIDLFRGFAVGRSIWWNPVAALCAGHIGESEARDAVAGNYLAVIDAYEAAASPD